MTTVIIPNEIRLSHLKVPRPMPDASGREVLVKVGEYVEVEQMVKQRMRVTAVEDDSVLLEWP